MKFLILLHLSSLCYAGIGLPTALEMAMQKSPTVSIVNLELKKSENLRKNAQSDLLPKIDLSSSILHTDEGESDPPTNTLSMTVSWDLYGNGDLYSLLRQRKLELEQQTIRQKQVRDRLALEIVEIFFDLSAQVETERVQARQLATLNFQLKSVREQMKAGVKPRQDFLRFHTKSQRAKLGLMVTKAEINNLRNRLNAKIGAENELDFSSQSIQDIDRPVIRPTVSQYTSVRLAELQQRIQAHILRRTERNYYPQINMGIQGTHAQSNYLALNTAEKSHSRDWQAGLTLTYNLWDTFQLSRLVENSQYDLEQSREDLRSKQIEIQSLIFQTQQQTSRLYDAYLLSIELTGVSRETFEVLERKFRTGQVSYLDYVSGIDEYLDSQLTLQQAYFSLMKNIARLHYYQGDIYEVFTR